MNLLSVIYPVALLAAPLALAYLIWIYRRRGTGLTKIVSTTFLLRRLSDPVSARKKFVPPPRFFFELLLFLLLICALAGLSLSGARTKVAILIDNSISTSLKLPDHSSAFIKIKAAAEEKLLQLALTTDTVIYQSSPVLLRVDSLDQIEPVLAEDFLEAKIIKLSSETELSKIYVYSDRPFAEKEQQDLSIQTIPEPNSRKSLQNIGLTGLALKGAELEIHVKNFGAAKAEAKINITNEKKDLVQALPLSLEPNTEKTFRPKLNNDSSGQFFIDLEAIGFDDALEFDNQASFTTKETGPSILLVSDLTTQELGLDKLTQYKFRHLTPKQYAIAQEQDEQEILGYLFHRSSSTQDPTKPALYIYSPIVPGGAQIGADVENPAIIGWSSGSELLTYLGQPKFKIPLLSPIKNASWAKEIINSTAGPALIAGELSGARVVATGFEILPFSGSNNAPLSVLTLNIFKWLYSEQNEKAKLHNFIRPSESVLQDIQNLSLPNPLREIGLEKKTFDLPLVGFLVLISLGLLSLDMLIQIVRGR